MASDGKRDEVDDNKERSRKRKTSAEGDESSKRHERKMKSDDEDGKRREKHRHKHRKHKHRSHRKHKHDKSRSDEDIDRVDSAKEDSAVDMASSERNSQRVARVGDETEDGEILDASHMEGNNGELDNESNAPKEDGNDAEVSSDQDKVRSTSPRERDEPREHSRISRSSPDRKRRSRSRESFRDHVVSRHYSRVASPDRKRRRSRSRDSTVRRGDDRISRRPAYSPRTRDYDDRDRRPRGYDDRDRRRSRSRDCDDHDKRRSRSRDHDDRGRYSRKRGDSRDRNYRDDQRYHRNRTAVNRRDREENQETKQEDLTRDEDNQEEYLERVANQLAQQEEDIEKVKEERRQRRQAILEKYKKQQQNQTEDEAETKATDEAKSLKAPFELVTEPELAVDSGEGIIDPSTPLSLGKLPSHNGNTMKRNPVGLGEGSPPKSERSADMFCDIFGESPAEVRKVGKGDGLAVDTSGLTDNWDDADGYYTYRVGEVLDSRYEIASAHGRGVFSTVVRARDSKAVREDPEEVAIKIIRNNETMYKAGQRELIILKKLAGADTENRRHCVRLLSSFEYRNHLCLVFESLHMNLREILKKFGRNIGISLNAVRSYAKQLFIALKHLRNCGVLHCDIKPDNMLVNEAKNVLKLCDFGSAMFAGENEITPYLVSRFYRAPEIILGLPYDHALDIWSVGCCLYELYSGKVLFPGPTNNDMLRLHMELKGPFPKKMLRKAAFAHQHFDQDYNFCATEEDPVTKKALKRLISNVRPKDISSLIMSSGNADEDPKLLGNFKLMLEKIFILDPEKRLTVSQALNHPFITGK